MTQRTALVTGGTGGIGSAIIHYLAKQGHRVATNYRDQAKAEAWRQKMASEGIEVLLVPGDVSDPASSEAMVRAVEDALGPVEILVNNAGITRDTTFHKMSYQQWTEVVDDPVCGRLRNPEQRSQLSHRQVRAPVRRDQQKTVLQRQIPGTPAPLIRSLLASNLGYRLGEAARGQTREGLCP